MNYTWPLAVKSSAAISTKLQPVSSSFSQPSPWISILLGQRTRSTMNASDFLPHQTFILRWHAAKHPQRKLRSNMILLCSIEDQLEPSSARWKEIDIFPTCYRLSWFQKKKPGSKTKLSGFPCARVRSCSTNPGSQQPESVPFSQACHHFQCRKTCPGRRPFRKTWPSLVEWQRRQFLGSETKCLYRTTAHIHMSMNWPKRYCDIVLVIMIFHPKFLSRQSVYLYEYNSIPKKAVNFPCLNCAFASFAAAKASSSAISCWFRCFPWPKSYTLDLVDLNDVVGQELQGDSLLLTYQLMGLLCNSCFCWKLGYAALTQWSQPMPSWPAPSLHQIPTPEGTSDLTPSYYYQLQALPWRIGWRSSPNCGNQAVQITSFFIQPERKQVEFRGHQVTASKSWNKISSPTLATFVSTPGIAHRSKSHHRHHPVWKEVLRLGQSWSRKPQRQQWRVFFSCGSLHMWFLINVVTHLRRVKYRNAIYIWISWYWFYKKQTRLSMHMISFDLLAPSLLQQVPNPGCQLSVLCYPAW